MAVANTKSNIVTNADAKDGTKTAALVTHGRLREQAATVEAASADDAGSVYRLFRVHTSWRISELKIGHDALTNMTTADLGVYDVAENGGAVIDVDQFGSAIDMSAASSGLVDRSYEAANADISKIEQALWERLGLSTDPKKFVDIAVTATTNDPSAAGTIAGLCRYVDGT